MPLSRHHALCLAGLAAILLLLSFLRRKPPIAQRQFPATVAQKARLLPRSLMPNAAASAGVRRAGAPQVRRAGAPLSATHQLYGAESAVLNELATSKAATEELWNSQYAKQLTVAVNQTTCTQAPSAHASVDALASLDTRAAPSLVRFDFDAHEGDCRPGGLLHFATRQELDAHPQWRRYFEAVYGELPGVSSFPLCISQLSRLYTALLFELNITLPPASYDLCERDEAAGAVRAWSYSAEPPWMIYLLHYKPVRKPLPSHTWVEVTHRARTLASGYERHGMWFSVAGGTGVWFNTGRTIAFDHHHEGFKHFGAAWETDMAQNASAAGFDTVQFLYGDDQPHPCCDKLGECPALKLLLNQLAAPVPAPVPVQLISLLAGLGTQCFGLEFVATRMTGLHACGALNGSNVDFRAGWDASRLCACTEDNVGRTNSRFEADRYVGYVNCKTYASHCAAGLAEAKALDKSLLEAKLPDPRVEAKRSRDLILHGPGRRRIERAQRRDWAPTAPTAATNELGAWWSLAAMAIGLSAIAIGLGGKCEPRVGLTADAQPGDGAFRASAPVRYQPLNI